MFSRGDGPTGWRLENTGEVLDRAAFQRRQQRQRSAEWPAKYQHLRLCHTSVSHSAKPRQLVRTRPVFIHPEDLATVAATDSWVLGGWTWRQGGTQTVDGYWQSLRKHGGHRGINTQRREALSNCVLLHSWAQWAGPSTDLVQHLGHT